MPETNHMSRAVTESNRPAFLCVLLLSPLQRCKTTCNCNFSVVEFNLICFDQTIGLVGELMEQLNYKKRFGDRPDGRLMRELDSMHIFMPYTVPNRADNEAVLKERIDLRATLAWLEEKNAQNPAFRYTIFHVVAAAIIKAVALRPKMNCYVANKRNYERDELSASFIVKQEFADNAHEAVAICRFDRSSEIGPIEQLRSFLDPFLHSVRRESKKDGTTDILDTLVRLPLPVMRFTGWLLRLLDRTGHMPRFIWQEDPYYTSVFISNLGSIRMKADYHHLANWGTNSVFVVINQLEEQPWYQPDGSYEMRPTLELGLTVDERIADGIYFAKTIRLFGALLQNPDLLELPILQPVEEELIIKQPV